MNLHKSQVQQSKPKSRLALTSRTAATGNANLCPHAEGGDRCGAGSSHQPRPSGCGEESQPRPPTRGPAGQGDAEQKWRNAARPIRPLPQHRTHPRRAPVPRRPARPRRFPSRGARHKPPSAASGGAGPARPAPPRNGAAPGGVGFGCLPMGPRGGRSHGGLRGTREAAAAAARRATPPLPGPARHRLPEDGGGGGGMTLRAPTVDTPRGRGEGGRECYRDLRREGRKGAGSREATLGVGGAPATRDREGKRLLAEDAKEAEPSAGPVSAALLAPFPLFF